jgi:predicted nucleic acid-binding protein
MRQFILDSWAVMAWLRNQEPAAALVERLLEAAERRENRLTMNIMNVGEVYYLCVKEKDLAYGERVLDMLRARIDLVSAPDELVMMAAGLKARYAISYADGFAAATAIRAGAPLVTGDKELRALAPKETDLKLEWIGA